MALVVKYSCPLRDILDLIFIIRRLSNAVFFDIIYYTSYKVIIHGYTV